jgi:hypothetical protein
VAQTLLSGAAGIDGTNLFSLILPESTEKKFLGPYQRLSAAENLCFSFSSFRASQSRSLFYFYAYFPERVITHSPVDALVFGDSLFIASIANLNAKVSVSFWATAVIGLLGACLYLSQTLLY